jgi:hypothetical protein
MVVAGLVALAYGYNVVGHRASRDPVSLRAHQIDISDDDPRCCRSCNEIGWTRGHSMVSKVHRQTISTEES